MEDKGDDGLLSNVKTNLDIVLNEHYWCQINLLELFVFSIKTTETSELLATPSEMFPTF